MKRNKAFIGLMLCFGALAFLTQESVARAAENRLVTGKLIYVRPMPGGLDQWIIQDLRAWGNYQVTGNPEGVDLVLQAQTPPRKLRIMPQEHIPITHHKPRRQSILSLTVVDWVTGKRLWEARIVDRKRKQNPNSPAGPQTEIYARNLKPDQLAERCVDLLREYVNELKKGSPQKPQKKAGP